MHGRKHGIIPAYAGNTLAPDLRVGIVGDHPRVCGEHKFRRSKGFFRSGSSPRMRGTPRFRPWRDCQAGIIPAYAGNTYRLSDLRKHVQDHPRVCGEHVRGWKFRSSKGGSSPRMRGTPTLTLYVRAMMGIIPAYAGNTVSCGGKRLVRGDHPRVCGEHAAFSAVAVRPMGSSPRMRGTRMCSNVHTIHAGIIPAYAGNTLVPIPARKSWRDHPRVCGEHLWLSQCAALRAGSSPRMRGTPLSRIEAPRAAGIIPAYAGNTATSHGKVLSWWDHPNTEIGRASCRERV